MQSLQEQLDEQLKAMDGIANKHVATEEVVALQVAAQPKIVVEEVNKTVVETIATSAQNSVKSADRFVAFEWGTTRLNLIFVQNNPDSFTPPEFFNHNGRDYHVNTPFNSHVISADSKVTGYFQSKLLPFIEQLSHMVKPVSSSVNYTKQSEMIEHFKTIATSVMSNILRVLPKIENRFEIWSSIDIEKSSMIDRVCLEFYLVYRTDYTAEKAEQAFEKAIAQIARHVSNNFKIINTAVFDLSSMPTNLTIWLEKGYTLEDYTTTKMLAIDKEIRANILGTLPGTKQLKPAIVLSKVLEKPSAVLKEKKEKTKS